MLNREDRASYEQYVMPIFQAAYCYGSIQKRWKLNRVSNVCDHFLRSIIANRKVYRNALFSSGDFFDCITDNPKSRYVNEPTWFKYETVHKTFSLRRVFMMILPFYSSSPQLIDSKNLKTNFRLLNASIWNREILRLQQ